MALQMLHKPMPKVPNFGEPSRSGPVPAPSSGFASALAGPGRSFVPPPPRLDRPPHMPPTKYGDMDMDGFRGGRDEPPSRFGGPGGGARDPRSRDPRGERGAPPSSRDMMEGPGMGRPATGGPPPQVQTTFKKYYDNLVLC